MSLERRREMVERGHPSLPVVAVMVRDKHAGRLEPEQKEELQHLIRVGKSSARARILLKSDDGCAAPQVAQALNVALCTVYRIKQHFAEEGLDRALWDRRQANRYRKLDDRGEAHLVAPRSWPGAGFGLQPSARGP